MRARVPHLVAAIALLALATACQKPDVGQPCTLTWGADASTKPSAAQLYDAAQASSPPSFGSDYFETGNLACEGLVCIISPAPLGTEYGSATPGEGYCSKPCLSDDDCYASETKLVCRQMVLDKVFIEQLDAATRQRYLSDVQFSSYCAVSR
jgi:hypothetical protein